MNSRAELTCSQLSFPVWRWRMAGDIPRGAGRAGAGSTAQAVKDTPCLAGSMKKAQLGPLLS